MKKGVRGGENSSYRTGCQSGIWKMAKFYVVLHHTTNLIE